MLTSLRTCLSTRCHRHRRRRHQHRHRRYRRRSFLLSGTCFRFQMKYAIMPYRY